MLQRSLIRPRCKARPPRIKTARSSRNPIQSVPLLDGAESHGPQAGPLTAFILALIKTKTRLSNTRPAFLSTKTLGTLSSTFQIKRAFMDRGRLRTVLILVMIRRTTNKRHKRSKPWSSKSPILLSTLPKVMRLDTPSHARTATRTS